MNHIFAKRDEKKNPEYIPKDFTKEDEILSKYYGKEVVEGGYWTKHFDIDIVCDDFLMMGKGNVDHDPKWLHKSISERMQTIEDFKKKVVEKGWSAIWAGNGKLLAKKFSSQLTKEHCCPCTEGYSNFYIFHRDDPDSWTAEGCRTVLVKHGSPQQAVFQDIGLLKEGKVATMRLSSHGGKLSLGKIFFEEYIIGSKTEINTGAVSYDSSNTIYIQYVDGNLIRTVDHEPVLSTICGEMSEGLPVNFPEKEREKKEQKEWILNDDGTIALKHHPNFVLGFD